jgi:membrane peptidoglycan carboxypeptidase
MASDDLTPDSPEVNGSSSHESDELPIPAIPYIDPRIVEDRRRLRHRRKRYALYVLRSHRRRAQDRSQGVQRAFLIAIATALALVLAVAGTATALAVSYYNSQLPLLEALQGRAASTDSVRIYDMHGTLLYQVNNAGVQHTIDLEQIPCSIVNATVATEDKTFFTNDGVDWQRILQAAVQDYQSNSPAQGASTITQQVIKNNVLDSEVTLDRKIREAILAFGMTTTGLYSKAQILAIYLNTVPYGPDIYGVDAAAHAYFDYNDTLNAPSAPTTRNEHCTVNPTSYPTAALHLDLAQSSFLAGIPQNPVGYNPLTTVGLQQALNRQQQVLHLMIVQGYITQAQADAAIKESHKPNFIQQPPPVQNLAPHFVQYVLDQLSTMVDTGQLTLSRSGLSVYTTLDLPLQNIVQQVMYDHLFIPPSKGGDVDDYGTYIYDDNVSNAAAVLIQQTTGDIRVLLGSYDYYATVTPNGIPVDGKYDVATDGYRSPGSTFKALVYSTAFSMGWFPAMTLNDVPTIFPSGTSNYKPLDAEKLAYDGEMTIRHALQHSMDIPAIKTLQFIGIPNLLDTMQRMGMSYQGTPGLASAIGALGVHLIDMVDAYATFANYGTRIPVNSIDHIEDGSGNLIYQYVPPRGYQVFSPQVSFLLTSVLDDNAARGGNHGFGICSPLRLYTNSFSDCAYAGNPGIDYPVASKTGTTDNLADDWALGYTMDFTGGVWVGNSNEGDYMHDIDGITGAAPIWQKMMLAAEGCTVLPYSQYGGVSDKGCRPTQPFPVPQGVVRAKYSSNGITSTDWFIQGSVPSIEGTGNGGPTHLCVSLNDATNVWNYCGSASAATTPASFVVGGGNSGDTGGDQGGGTGGGPGGGGHGGGGGPPGPIPPPQPPGPPGKHRHR